MPRPTAVARAPRAGRTLAAVAAAVVAAVTMTACGSSAGGSGSTTLSLVGYSVPKPAYDGLTSAFAKTSAGKGVTWKASYGASGDQSRAVANGQKADYVAFSTEPDMTRLVPSKVDASWNSGATKGIVADTTVVLVVRKGNPKGITGWNDLVKPGVKIVTPDPGSSGSAKWNILAAYSHVLADGGSADEATSYLTSFYKNIVSKPESGSKATQTFLNGTGDVLVSYEAEAIATRAKGQDVDYLVPRESILIETPAAVTKGAPKAAKDFLAYAESSAGQQVFAAHGFRPMGGASAGTVKGANDPSNPYPKVQVLTTIAQLGGWTKVNKEFFDPDTGVVTRIAKDTA